MIGQRFYLDKYKWSVVVLYNVDSDDSEFIKDNLSKICDNKQQIKDSTYYIEQQIPNTGFIFSNLEPIIFIPCGMVFGSPAEPSCSSPQKLYTYIVFL